MFMGHFLVGGDDDTRGRSPLHHRRLRPSGHGWMTSNGNKFYACRPRNAELINYRESSLSKPLVSGVFGFCRMEDRDDNCKH